MSNYSLHHNNIGNSGHSGQSGISDSSKSNIITIESSIKSMRETMNHYIENHLYYNAVFYAEKIFNLSQNINSSNELFTESLFNLVRMYYLNQEYYRCINLIQKYNMAYYNIIFLNLLGQALTECEDYEGVINFLQKETEFTQKVDTDLLARYQSIRYYLLAKAYEFIENKSLAIKNYLLSLRYDPTNINSFENLIHHQLLSVQQKSAILNDISFTQDTRWLSDYYKSKSSDSIFMTQDSDVIVGNNKSNIVDLLLSFSQDFQRIEAEKFFSLRDYNSVYMKIKKMHEEDPYNLGVLAMYCVSLIELNKVGDLYYLAHKLVNTLSKKYVSWFAVACFYYSVNKFEISRRYFIMCNQLNKNFPEGWIALGNSYAATDESDQALGAYRSCLRLFPGCHHSHIFIGMEFIRTNNLKAALNSFNEAILISDSDPEIYNEIGVVYYKLKDFEQSELNLLKGLHVCKESSSNIYQNLLTNLGHTYRRLKKIDKAIECFLNVLRFNSKNSSVLSALALCQHLNGDYNEALDTYHKANFNKTDDPIINECINKCLSDMLETGQDFEE